MTASALRARRPWHARTGRVRSALAAAALLAVVPAAACGISGGQTSRPYTPSEGVNFDVGDQANPDSVIHVRNLLVISRSAGTGIISATMVTSGRDTLTGVTGVPYKADSSKGTPFTAELPAGPVLLTNNAQVVLTNQQPLITFSGAPGLTAGLDADVTLQFGKAGSITTRTPVVDGNLSPYSEITPSASPSASASPSVTAAPSPTP